MVLRRIAALILSGTLLGMGTIRAAEHTGVLKEVKDPYFGDTLFYFYQQEYFSSIVHLTAAQQEGRIEHHKDEANLLLGGLYLSYGMDREASEIFERYIDDNVTPSVRDRAWFYLAKIRYQRGQLREAEAAISHVGDALPRELQKERQVLQANLLMARKQYQQAADVLHRIKDRSGWGAYARYNLGIALIKAGQDEHGTALLEKVGQMRADGEEMLAVKDQANLALGYFYLQQKQAEQGKRYLERVRLNGPLSNKALLGMGWAYSDMEQHKKSLVPWLELQKRNVSDPAVQESLLAAPYALAQIDAHQQSLENYQKAIDVYSHEIEQLQGSIQSIRNGKLVENILRDDPSNQMGWFWKLRQTPETPEGRYLIQLLASHTFQEALKNYRDLRFLQKNLQRWADNIGVYEDMLATRRQAYEERLPRIRQTYETITSDSLQAQRDGFADEIARLEQSGDALALANTKELKTMARLDKVETNLRLLSGHNDTSEAQEKYRMLRGLLVWQIATDFAPRLWTAMKELQQLDEVIAEAARRRESLLRAQQDAPKAFEGFGGRINTMRHKIDTMLPQVQATAQAQEEYLQELAVSQLERRQQRLSTYLAQARYAVAQIYDRGTKQPQGEKAK